MFSKPAKIRTWFSTRPQFRVFGDRGNFFIVPTPLALETLSKPVSNTTFANSFTPAVPPVTFDGEHQMNVNETAPYPRKWLCHYPHSKALAEKFVLEADDDKELMTCALRPHLIWGPGDRHLIPRLIKRAKQNSCEKSAMARIKSIPSTWTMQHLLTSRQPKRWSQVHPSAEVPTSFLRTIR